MIEKIRLCVADESGALIEIPESPLKLQSKLDVLIADTFSEIVRLGQAIADDEIRTAEKFNLAVNLKNYLQEMKENVSITAAN
jgi:hypothetical protein